MNIPASLAQQLLESNFKNICAKLEAGGTLTTAERHTFEKNAAALGPASPSVVAPAPLPATSFTLDPTAPLPARLRNYYQFTYADYATGENGAPNYRNSKDGRTVKRWVSYGRNCAPPDLPPLDDPPRMAAWFRRAFPKEPAPPVLLDYESRSPRNPPASLEQQTTNGGEPAAFTKMPAIRFRDLEAEEGQAVRRARNIEQANGQQVESASAKGDEDAYRKWFPIWRESSSLLRQLEKEDRDARKASGDLVARGPVFAELSQLLEALRIMRDGMDSKILAELEKAATGRTRRILRLAKPLLREAVLKVRGGETALFLALESLTSPEVLKEKLAA